ncbi:MAG: hypothetical protein AB1635_10220 [Acidobacteriota bacterium]
MAHTTGRWLVVPALLALTLLVPASPIAGQGDEKKPSLALRASPSIAFAPARIFVRAEIRGGADDFEEFYCAAVEWDWGDGTRSENATDCPPYEAGKSQIRRQYAVQHTYRQPGSYRITLRLKQGGRVVAASATAVQIRAGLP